MKITERVDAYICPICKHPHWELEEAVECCQELPVKRRGNAWACDICRELYSSKEDAEDCCPDEEETEED